MLGSSLALAAGAVGLTTALMAAPDGTAMGGRVQKDRASIPAGSVNVVAHLPLDRLPGPQPGD